MKKKLILFTLILMVCTGCTEFAILSSGATLAVNQNIYAKTYGAVDFFTIIKTEKNMRTHAVEILTKAYKVVTDEKKTND